MALCALMTMSSCSAAVWLCCCLVVYVSQLCIVIFLCVYFKLTIVLMRTFLIVFKDPWPFL